MDIKRVYLFWEGSKKFENEVVNVSYTTGQRLYLEENSLNRKWVERKMLGIPADKNTNKRRGISIVDISFKSAVKNLSDYLNNKIEIKNKEIKKLQNHIKILGGMSSD